VKRTLFTFWGRQRYWGESRYTHFVLLGGVEKVDSDIADFHEKGEGINGDKKHGILTKTCIEQPKHCTE
jgi:hypothetical protein